MKARNLPEADAIIKESYRENWTIPAHERSTAES